MNNLNDTTHKIFFEDCSIMKSVPNNSIDLVVTSPPYPMIGMRDEIFWKSNPEIIKMIQENNWTIAFDLMHENLDSIWMKINEKTKDWAIVCINIWDATRTIWGKFSLYNNHSRIVQKFTEMWFSNLPNIIWKKQTNSPNKFMGSWVLPVWAYITLEHEYILVFRKWKKREFKTDEEKKNRQRSSFFFEERNIWFSDIRDNIKWVKQKLNKQESRERSAAYPLELAYRLINMFSVYWDTILDPFLWTGTTTIAAMLAWRNSFGTEIDNSFAKIIDESIANCATLSSKLISNRLINNDLFV